MKIKCWLSRVGVPVLLISVATQSVFAFDYHPSATLSVSEVSGQSITAHSEFSYTSDQVREIKQLNANDNFVAIEHRSLPSDLEMGVGSSTTGYYTTAPNPYYDREDDDKNGWYEESEITILGSMTGGKKYAFSTFYNKDKSVLSGTINLNSQRSVKNTPFNEYNTVPGSSKTIAYKSWGSKATDLAQKNTGIMEVEVNNEDALDEYKTAISFPTNKVELDQYIAKQNSVYDTVFKNQVLSAETPLKGVITFTEPILMNDLLYLLNDSNCELVDYQAKFYNCLGDWCTFGGSMLDEDQMIELANAQAEFYGVPHTSYEGITSATIILNDGKESLDNLKLYDSIYYVDLPYCIDNGVVTSKGIRGYAWEINNMDS